MSLKDNVIEYYKKGYNCAESMLHGANEYYMLNLKPNDLKIASAFGKGMSVVSTCGVITGSLMVLSLKFGRSDVSEKSRANVMAKEFITSFRETTSCSLDCRELLKFRTPHEGCTYVLGTGCDLLEKLVSLEEAKQNE